MSGVTDLLLDVFLVYLAAKVASELFERIRQPAVVGELLVGVLIGPYALGIIGLPRPGLIEAFHGDVEAAEEALSLAYHLISELGVVVLLFFVGLETRIAELLRVGRLAAVVAASGVVLPFGLGYGLIGPLLGHSQIEALFIGVAMVATSVGITARVLRDLGVIASLESRIILGAAVIDDILGMVLLAVVAGLAATGFVSPLDLAIIVGEAVLFTLFVALVGTGIVRRYSLGLARLRMDGGPFAVSLLVMLGLSVLAAFLGLAPIIGAFLAGMVFAEAREHFALEHQALPVYQFLVPFFFVLTGSQVDWRLFLEGSVMGTALALTGLALVGKIIGCGLPTLTLGHRSAAIVGIGMAPRGEVGLIVANLGLSMNAISGDAFSIVVIMSILTTLVVPSVLRVLYVGRPDTALSAEDEESQSGQLPEL